MGNPLLNLSSTNLSSFTPRPSCRYCAKKSISKEHIRFTFDGDAVADDDTPLSLELEEGDAIDAFTRQTGGGAC